MPCGYSKDKMKALLLVLMTCMTTLAIDLKFDLQSDDDICRLLPDNTVLRKPGTCNQAIKCINSVTTEVENINCAGSTPVYDPTEKKCVKKANDDYCKIQCTKKSKPFIKNPQNCQGWHQCKDGEYHKSGYCPEGQFFDESEQICNYSELVSCTLTYDLCDVVPKEVKILDENNCDKYFLCDKSKGAQSKECESNTYFDVKTGECIEKARVACKRPPYPDDVCGNNKIPIRNRFVPDGATCRGYFYCKDPGESSRNPDKEPFWGQCPPNTFFNAKEQACLSPTQAKCDEDRCDGRESGFALSEKPGCQYYHECKNNYSEKKDLYCGDNLYFDVKTETCTSTKQTYLVCQK